MYRNARYQVNEDFFTTIDTEEKAYVLGFMYADGTVVNKNGNYQMVLTLQEDDREILEKIMKIISPNRPIRYIKPSKSGYSKKGSYRLCITNKKIVTDLCNLGFDKLKPERKTIPLLKKELIHHFVRGYFDGDGFISISARGDYELSFLGTDDFIDNLKQIIPNITRPVSKHKTISKIRFSGKNKVRDIAKFLYKDSNIYLQRKYDKVAALLSDK